MCQVLFDAPTRALLRPVAFAFFCFVFSSLCGFARPERRRLMRGPVNLNCDAPSHVAAARGALTSKLFLNTRPAPLRSSHLCLRRSEAGDAAIRKVTDPPLPILIHPTFTAVLRENANHVGPAHRFHEDLCLEHCCHHTTMKRDRQRCLFQHHL